MRPASKCDNPPLPGDFADRISRQFPDEAGAFLRALDEPGRTSIRIHPQKWERISDDPVPPGEPVAWSRNGFFLDKRPSFTLDPLFHAGSYYVQEASSMFLERVLTELWPDDDASDEGPGLILDACAAPGGKTTLMASHFPDAMIVANEVIRSRVPALMENSIKWGTGNIAVTRNESFRFDELGGFFDLILADAPCSGEGLFRKDPDARLEWTPDNARHCSLRQRSILSDIWPALRPGGYLIYTTCTFNPDENERNIARLLDQTGGECVRLDTNNRDGMTGESRNGMQQITEIREGPVTGYGFLPHRTGGEGFFLSIIRKPGSGGAVGSTGAASSRSTGGIGDAGGGRDTGGSRGAGRGRNTGSSGSAPGGRGAAKRGGRNSSNKIGAAGSTAVEQVRKWYPDEPCDWYQIGDRLFRLRGNHMHSLRLLSSVLTVLYAGTEVGKVIRDEVRPAAAAALDIHLDASFFPQITCNREKALQFLRRESLPVPENGTSGGWYLAMHRGLPLGWMKHVGRRMNNYHPAEWRIRK